PREKCHNATMAEAAGRNNQSDGGDFHVFDRAAVRRNRERAAAGFAAHAFLVDEVAGRLAERLAEINRPFPRALDLGAHHGAMREHLTQRGTDIMLSADLAKNFVNVQAGPRLVADEEALPFAAQSFDLV